MIGPALERNVDGQNFQIIALYDLRRKVGDAIGDNGYLFDFLFVLPNLTIVGATLEVALGGGKPRPYIDD
jgi:hypothetical protein